MEYMEPQQPPLQSPQPRTNLEPDADSDITYNITSTTFTKQNPEDSYADLEIIYDIKDTLILNKY